MKGNELTQKQKMFCEQYVIDWNATRAAIYAGYSEKTAKVIGYENLTKPYINEYITEIQKDLQKLAGISRLRIVQEYMKIAFSSIAHLHNNWVTLKDFDELTDDQKSCISEIQTRERKIMSDDGSDVGMIEEVKIKLYDKQKALENISKMLGYNEAEKIDHKIQVEEQVFKIGNIELKF